MSSFLLWQAILRNERPNQAQERLMLRASPSSAEELDDGVQYLAPVEDRWGEIAVYPELMAEYAERLRALIRRVWVDEPPGGHVIRDGDLSVLPAGGWAIR
jgi:hypothetical protein